METTRAHDRLGEVPPVRVQVDRELLVVVEQLLRVRHRRQDYRSQPRAPGTAHAPRRSTAGRVGRGAANSVTAMDAQALLADLDERQRAAVVTPSTLVAVIAAAGSGKTRVLTRRIAYRIADGTADARHTLALTFTREAAGELRRRLRRLGLRDPVEAGTFHSVALGVLSAAVGRHRPPSADDRRPARAAHRRAGRAVGRGRRGGGARLGRGARRRRRCVRRGGPGGEPPTRPPGGADRRGPRRLRDAETPSRGDRLSTTCCSCSTAS